MDSDSSALGVVDTVSGLFADQVSCEQVAQDWSGIVRLIPRAVLRPSGPHDIADALRWCALHGVQAVPRGAGTSTAGLSQIEGVIDLSSLVSITVDRGAAVPSSALEPGGMMCCEQLSTTT